MKRKIAKMNTANKITFFRIVLIPFFILFLFVLGKKGIVISLVIFVVASFSDWLDGYVARKKNQITTMGKIIDPVADKILTYSAFICFIYFHIIPFWMVIIIMARDFLVMALRVQLAAQGTVLAASSVAKFKTVLEYGAILFVFIYLLSTSALVRGVLGISIYFLMGLVTVFALISGIQYLLKGRRKLIR